MISALLLGISYGFASGISPGPLLGLVITRTLQRGWRAGSLVAIAPLLSDLPIILLALLVLSHLPTSVLGWLGILGGLFVLYLGGETLFSVWKATHRQQKNEYTESQAIAEEDKLDAKESSLRALGKAVTTNTLNPHPYIFWTTVGSQLLIRTLHTSGVISIFIFLLGFYLLLVGSKLGIVLIVSRSRQWLKGRVYQGILAGSGLLLLGLGLLLIWESANSL